MYLVINLVILLLFFSFISVIRVSETIKNWAYITSTIVSVLIFHTFKDYTLLPDIPQYIETFKYISRNNASYEDANKMYKMKEGYYYLNKVIGYIWVNPQFFMFIIGAIISTPYFILIKKYNKRYAWIACLLYYMGFVQSTFVLRQHIAISMCVMCVPLLAKTDGLNCKYIKEILLLTIIPLLAITIHPTAILFLLLIACYYIKNYKLLFFIIAVCAYIIYNYLYDIAFYFAMSAGDYLQYMEEKEFPGWGTIVLNWGLLLFATISLKKMRDMQNHWMIMYKGLLLSALLSLISLADAASDAIPRLIMYLNCFSCIFIPFVISNIRYKFLRILIIVFFLILYFYNFAISERSYINDCKLADLL